jgi:hypothetical protein
LAFLQNDRQGVLRELAVLNSKPEDEPIVLGAEGNMAYYDGKVAAGRKLLHSQIEAAQRTGIKSAATNYVIRPAIWESLLGNVDWARKTALQAARSTQNADNKGYLALALSGDTDLAAQLLDEVAKALP